MWLGTFGTAVEAACAYEIATCWFHSHKAISHVPTLFLFLNHSSPSSNNALEFNSFSLPLAAAGKAMMLYLELIHTSTRFSSSLRRLLVDLDLNLFEIMALGTNFIFFCSSACDAFVEQWATSNCSKTMGECAPHDPTPPFDSPTKHNEFIILFSFHSIYACQTTLKFCFLVY